MPDIWDINVPALRLFLDLATQWRVVALGGGFAPARVRFLGLDYAAADVVMRRKGHEGTEVFEDLQVMEGAALEAFAEGTAA